MPSATLYCHMFVVGSKKTVEGTVASVIAQLLAVAIIFHFGKCRMQRYPEICVSKYSGTSLIWSPTGLGKSDLNGEVTLLQGVICTVEYNLGLSQGDCNGEVFLLVR